MSDEESEEVQRGRWDLYEDGESKNKSCPRCGEGFLLAEHDDRRTCGKCEYVEKKE